MFIPTHCPDLSRNPIAVFIHHNRLPPRREQELAAHKGA